MDYFQTAGKYFGLNTYNYDTPDGADCLKKTANSTRVGALLGAYISLYDIIGRTHPKGVAAVTARALHFTLPAAAAGAVFASTSCIVGDYRGQDGMLNHALGGCAAGLVFGVKMKSYAVASSTCVGLGLAAGIWKEIEKINKLENPNDMEILMAGRREPMRVQGSLGHHERYYGPKNPKAPEPDNY